MKRSQQGGDDRTTILSTSRGVWTRAIVLGLLALLAGSMSASAQMTGQGGSTGPDLYLGPDEDPRPLPIQRLQQSVRKRQADQASGETDPDRPKRPPFELIRSRIAPFEILPFVKPYHWCSLETEWRSNEGDFVGRVETDPVPLANMPRAINFGRDARMVERQLTPVSWPILLASVEQSSTLPVELMVSGGDRTVLRDSVTLQRMRSHQMLIVILSDDLEPYKAWSRYRALIPRDPTLDESNIERYSYYRIVTPLGAQSSEDSEIARTAMDLLPTHPLTWTTISHVIWDGLSFDRLGLDQLQGLEDWLVFGGQLTLIASGPGADLIYDSPLAELLPADSLGRADPLDVEALTALSGQYRPPFDATDFQRVLGDEPRFNPERFQSYEFSRNQLPYRPVERIVPAPGQPVELTRLRPRPGSTVIPIAGTDRLLAVERRIGRGRITMLAVDPSDPALQRWGGLDTLVRRVILRRPEEGRQRAVRTGRLYGTELSWLRYTARDLGAEAVIEVADQDEFVLGSIENIPKLRSERPVAAWLDGATLPSLAREILREASGITIPARRFVITIVVAYCLALVPLNFLVCQFGFRRREIAWILAPLIAIGFAIIVERAAALDLGYDVAVDEIDVLELHGGYTRGHLSRFASVATSGRDSFTLGYPEDPSALVLPMSTGTTLRGESVSLSRFESSPIAQLSGYQVQPRSINYYRAEQLVDLGGSVDLIVEEGGERKVTNRTGLTLRDAVVVDVLNGKQTSIGTISAGTTTPLPRLESEAWVSRTAPPRRDRTQTTAGSEARTDEPANDRADGGQASASEVVASSGYPVDLSGVEDPEAIAILHPEVLLAQIRDGSLSDRLSRDQTDPAGRRLPEILDFERRELRLVAWTEKAWPGQEVEPGINRYRGVTLVIAHLRFGAAPSPSDPAYDQTSPGFRSQGTARQ